MTSSAQQQFTVPDMDCQGCVSSITGAVQRLDREASVTADLDSKQVVVASLLPAAEIAHAIEDAGFTVQAG